MKTVWINVTDCQTKISKMINTFLTEYEWSCLTEQTKRDLLTYNMIQEFDITTEVHDYDEDDSV